MTHHLLQEIEKKFTKKVPVIRPGYSVRISQKIREGEKERVQNFEGLVIGFNSGHGGSKMIKIRRMVEGIGVEKTFPLYSPLITKIVVTKTPKVRRAKLFYMRKLTGKATRLRSSVGLAAKDEKFGKTRSELMEGMGVDTAAEPVVSNAAEAEQMALIPDAPVETNAPETEKKSE